MRVLSRDHAEKLADELKTRYDGIADRLTLYTPFVPGEKDEFWKMIVKLKG